MDETKLLLLADKFRRLRDRVDGLSVKQDEIQTIKGDQGPKGEQGDRGFDGAPGKDGDDGADGTDGQDGKDGVSVVNAEITFDGSLVIYLSDGREIDCGEVVKETGDTVIQTLKQGAAVSGGGGVTSITSTDGSVVVTDVAGVVDLAINVFTSIAKGLVPASGGSSTQYLSADGTFTTPTATVTPAGLDTQIQYNNAGVLGANANFTYSSTLNTLSLGPQTGTATFTTRAPTTAQNPSTFVIAAQNSIRTAGTSPGGPLTLRSGNGRPTGAGAGGALSITSGNAGTTGDGGAINLTAGAGGTTSGNGGAINITGGSPTSGLGGDINITSGPAAFLYLNGGNNPNGNGGDVRGQAGQGSGAGVANGGNFLFTGGQANGASGGNGGGLEFTGGGGASAGGTGGGLSFRNGAGGTAADTDGDIYLYLNSGSSIPASLFLQSALGTSAIEITRNAGTGATEMGFFNATPVGKPAPTASGTGAVLSSVVTALNSLGLVDSTALTNSSAVFTSSATGLVPASGGGTTTFLRADGTFATPSGGGGGSSPTSGTATIDFGTGIGLNEASIAVTGQTSILSTSVVTLTVKNDATSTSHTANDHSYFLALASLNSNTPTAGTGFTIKARSIHKLTGTWTISWSWV